MISNTSWRTVIIDSHCMLSLSNNQMVVEKDDENLSIPTDQINNLLLSTNSGTMTLPLISRLSLQHVNILICDEKHSPVCEVVSLDNHNECAGNISDQAGWTKRRKNAIWKQVVKIKIQRQMDLLNRLGLTVPKKMTEYKKTVTSGDSTNREAMAARVYFDTLFGNDFIRHAEDEINHALNYGYAIIRSCVSRSISLHGFSMALGIHHHSRWNRENLSCDLMEPIRPFVDEVVYNNRYEDFDKNYRNKMVSLLKTRCIYNNRTTILENAIDAYVLDSVKAMNSPRKTIKEISFAKSS